MAGLRNPVAILLHSDASSTASRSVIGTHAGAIVLSYFAASELSLLRSVCKALKEAVAQCTFKDWPESAIGVVFGELIADWRTCFPNAARVVIDARGLRDEHGPLLIGVQHLTVRGTVEEPAVITDAFLRCLVPAVNAHDEHAGPGQGDHVGASDAPSTSGYATASAPQFRLLPLSTLMLERCPEVTGAVFSSLSDLKELSLSFCYGVTDGPWRFAAGPGPGEPSPCSSGLSTGIGNTAHPPNKLTKLHLYSCGQLKTDALVGLSDLSILDWRGFQWLGGGVELSTACPRLTELSLAFFTGPRPVIQWSKLRSLTKLFWSFDYSTTGCLRDLPRMLTELGVSSRQPLLQDGDVAHLLHMRKLSLSLMPEFSGSGLALLHRLRELHLNGCRDLVSLGFTTTSTTSASWSTADTSVPSSTPSSTSTALVPQQLAVLTIKNCPALDCRTIMAVAPYVEQLTLVGLRHLTDDVLASFSRVRVMHLTDCDGVTAAGVASLADCGWAPPSACSAAGGASGRAVPASPPAQQLPVDPQHVHTVYFSRSLGVRANNTSTQKSAVARTTLQKLAGMLLSGGFTVTVQDDDEETFVCSLTATRVRPSSSEPGAGAASGSGAHSVSATLAHAVAMANPPTGSPRAR